MVDIQDFAASFSSHISNRLVYKSRHQSFLVYFALNFIWIFKQKVFSSRPTVASSASTICWTLPRLRCGTWSPISRCGGSSRGGEIGYNKWPSHYWGWPGASNTHWQSFLSLVYGWMWQNCLWLLFEVDFTQALQYEKICFSICSGNNVIIIISLQL